MAKVHAVLERQEAETPAGFRKRCGEFLLYSEFPAATASGAVAVGRMTLIGDKHLKDDMTWGQAHDGPLPSNTCIIASYADGEINSLRQNGLLEINGTELRRAPVNPGLFPRPAHRMSLDEFQNAVKLEKDESDSDKASWRLFLDGRALGSAGGTAFEAMRTIHKNQVRAALQSCLTPDCKPDDDGASPPGWCLPSANALVWYPDLKAKYAREAALARRPLVWNIELGRAAQTEGWDLFDTDDGLQVQRDDEMGLLEKDIDAWRLVASGTAEHHILARTILAVDAPFESSRITHSLASDAIEVLPMRENC